MEVQFEFDEYKRQRCLTERGIDFYDAMLIWDDPLRQERVDRRRDYGELRYQTIGRAEAGVLFVVYTNRTYEKDGAFHRIISVRRANRKERQQYYDRTFAQEAQ